MTTITLPRRIMRPVASPPARRSVLIGFFATLAAGLLLFIGFSAALGLGFGSSVLPGVSVGGVALDGLDRAAAEARLNARLPSLSSGTATITVGETDEVVTYAELGRGYEMGAMVDAALGVGRGANPLADGLARVRSLVHPTSLPVIVHAYDAETLDRLAIQVSRSVAIVPGEAAVVREGTSFEVIPSRIGRTLDAATVRAALAGAVDNTLPDDVRIELSPIVMPPIVTTADAEAAAQAARGVVADLELTVPGAADGEAPLELPAETVATWISFGPQAEHAYAMRIDENAAAAAVAALVDDVNRDPVNARFSVAGSGLGGVIPGQSGRALAVDESVTNLLGALRQRGGGAPVGSLALAVDVTEPALTTEAAEAALPQMQMISSWTTYYTPNDGNGFGANINIPARDIDGRNLAPGEWFSFWGSIGPVTESRGFSYGGVIIGGRSVAGGAIGGGICSTSTTIFNAALRAGLEMGDRLNHYYYIDRYPNGLDATVYMDDSYVQDMTFRNDTEHPIVIRGFGGNGFVRFDLWSIPTGRTVAFSNPIVSNQRAAIETTQVDTSLAPGTSKRVEYPHNGHDVSVSRTVYNADGSVRHQNTYFSSYRVVNGITLVGPSRPAPPADDDGDDGATAGAGDGPPEE